MQTDRKEPLSGESPEAGGEDDVHMDCGVYRELLESEDAAALRKMCRCPEFCPIESAMEVFEGKWNVKVLYVLLVFGRLRFGQLQKHIGGISKTMLSSTLKTLEEHGLVIREQFNEIPPHVEYSLTEGGEAMKSVFAEIARWSSKYLSKPEDKIVRRKSSE